MRPQLSTVVAVLVALGGCNLFGPSRPSGFDGWYHLDRPGRATSLAFTDPSILELSDLGCDGPLSSYPEWVPDGPDTIVVTSWSGTPRFTRDPTQSGALLAQPGMYGSAQERWLPGATCLVCPVGDAGVAVACETPAVRDGGR